MNKILPFCFSLSLSFGAYALVDYSEPVGAAPEAVRPASKPAAPKKLRSNEGQATRSSSRDSSPFGLEFKLGYESLTAKASEGKASAALYRGSMHIQTPYSLFLDASTFYASSDDPQMTDKSSEQMGNPEFAIGLNWLQFASGADLGSVDLIAGYRLGRTDSDFASSRSDVLLGIESKKRFLDFALGLGYQYALVGKPKKSSELKVGNIHHIYGELGYQATSDIIFSLAAGFYSISPAEKEDNRSLNEKFTSGYFSPKLNLVLAPYIGLELGATFTGKHGVGAETMLKDGFYYLKGVYGDSLFANLVVSL